MISNFLLQNNAVGIWRYDQIPSEIQYDLGVLDPDIYWVAFVPFPMNTMYISFLQSSAFCGMGGPEERKAANGSFFFGRSPL